MINHQEIGKLEYSKITAFIFIGTNACCQTHFDEKLLGLGIEADISLEDKKLDSPFGVKFFLWLPVINHTAPAQEQLKVGVAFLDNLVKMKKKVYVHCQNGHGRAPTLAAAYLIKQGKNPDEAVAIVKTKRPSIHLEVSQKQALAEYFQKISLMNKGPDYLRKLNRFI